MKKPRTRDNPHAIEGPPKGRYEHLFMSVNHEVEVSWLAFQYADKGIACERVVGQPENGFRIGVALG